MNRRNFFGTIGAVIAGAVLGKNVQPQPDNPLHVRTFVADEVSAIFEDAFWGFSEAELPIDTKYGLSLATGEITRIDGKPIEPGSLYLDDNGVLQLRKDETPPVDFDWYSAWL